MIVIERMRKGKYSELDCKWQRKVKKKLRCSFNSPRQLKPWKHAWICLNTRIGTNIRKATKGEETMDSYDLLQAIMTMQTLINAS